MPLIRFKFFRFPASLWAAKNPILLKGEPGIEHDSGTLRLGNGTSPWSDLPVFLPKPAVEQLIADAVTDLSVSGVPGAKGDKGDKGDPGIQGPKGDTGAQGVKGDTGNAGSAGAQGIQGVKGDAGLQGPKGDTGTAGTNGSNGESVTVTLVPAASWPPAADSNPLHLYFRVP